MLRIALYFVSYFITTFVYVVACPIGGILLPFLKTGRKEISVQAERWLATIEVRRAMKIARETRDRNRAWMMENVP